MPVFVCLESDGKFVCVIVLYLNFVNTGCDLVRHKCLFWNKVLVCTTFCIDTTVVVSSADSWWPFLPTGHIHRDVTLSSQLELIKLLSQFDFKGEALYYIFFPFDMKFGKVNAVYKCGVYGVYLYLFYVLAAEWYPESCPGTRGFACIRVWNMHQFPHV